MAMNIKSPTMAMGWRFHPATADKQPWIEVFDPSRIDTGRNDLPVYRRAVAWGNVSEQIKSVLEAGGVVRPTDGRIGRDEIEMSDGSIQFEGAVRLIIDAVELPKAKGKGKGKAKGKADATDPAVELGVGSDDVPY